MTPQIPVNIENYRAYALNTTDIADTQSVKAALKRVPTDEKIEYIEVPLKVGGGDIYYASNNYFATTSGLDSAYHKGSKSVPSESATIPVAASVAMIIFSAFSTLEFSTVTL